MDVYPIYLRLVSLGQGMPQVTKDLHHGVGFHATSYQLKDLHHGVGFLMLRISKLARAM